MPGGEPSYPERVDDTRACVHCRQIYDSGLKMCIRLEPRSILGLSTCGHSELRRIVSLLLLAFVTR